MIPLPLHPRSGTFYILPSYLYTMILLFHQLITSYFVQLLQSLSYGLNYWLMESLSWRWLYLELVFDLLGGDITYYMMEYSYIVDVTKEHER